MALGIGYGLPFVAQHGSNPYKTQWAAALEGAKAAGATVEDENAGVGSCLVSRGQEAYTAGLPATPSLLIVPQFYKAGNLYQDVPPFVAEDSTMRFTVTRDTTARRVNQAGLIESVASGVPRIDWLGQSCPALLVEASGSNGILNSTDTATSWTLGSGLTSGAIDVIGVTGNNLTVSVVGNIGLNSSVLRRTSNNVALASGSTYTISFFIKKTGTHTIGGYYALITGAASGDLAAGFDVSGSFSSGSIYNSAGTTNRIRRVEQWGTDVFRCSETFTMTASGTLTTFHLAPVLGVTNSSNSAGGTQLGFAAPQIELSSVPTTFIPTTSGSVTRNADQITASGALVSGLIGQSEGTIYAEFVNTLLASYSEAYLFRVFADASNEIWARKEGGTNTYSFRWRANSQNTTFLNVAVSNGANKIAFGYKSGDTALFLNGAQVGSTSTDVRAFANNPNTIAIGSTSNDKFLNDRIRAAALYTTRLDNATLAQLTKL